MIDRLEELLQLAAEEEDREEDVPSLEFPGETAEIAVLPGAVKNTAFDQNAEGSVSSAQAEDETSPEVAGNAVLPSALEAVSVPVDMTQAVLMAEAARMEQGMSGQEGRETGGSVSVEQALQAGVRMTEPSGSQLEAVLEAVRAVNSEAEGVEWLARAARAARDGAGVRAEGVPERGAALEAEDGGPNLARTESVGGLETLYRETARAVSAAGQVAFAVAPAVMTAVEQAQPETRQLTVGELDRAVRRDSRRYDGGMTIF